MSKVRWGLGQLELAAGAVAACVISEGESHLPPVFCVRFGAG